MGSIEIDYIREVFPAKTEEESAASYARESGYVAIVRYKTSADGKYNMFGACAAYAELDSYLTSPNCHDCEIVYDAKNDPKGCRENHCPVCDTFLTITSNRKQKIVCHICGAYIKIESYKIVKFKEAPKAPNEYWEFGVISLSDGQFAARKNLKTGDVEAKVSAKGGWTWVHPDKAATFFITTQEYPPLT